MAILKVMPHQDIISGFKGTIDFYLHCGVPCARRWPRSPGHRRAPAVEAQWDKFAYASKMWSALPPELQYWYNEMASGTGLNGRDMFMRSYLTGLFRYSF